MAERYEIVTSTPVDTFVADALQGLESAPAGPGRWRVVGTVPDEAALLALLHRLNDLHAGLIEVRRLRDT